MRVRRHARPSGRSVACKLRAYRSPGAHSPLCRAWAATPHTPPDHRVVQADTGVHAPHARAREWRRAKAVRPRDDVAQAFPRRARTPHAALALPAAARQSRVVLSLHARVWLRPETRVSGRAPHTRGWRA